MNTLIIGASLSGKTTLANSIGLDTKKPVYSTDKIIFKLRKNSNLTEASFENEISKIVNKKTWIIEGRHFSNTAVSNANRIIWLDTPFYTCLIRKVRQSKLDMSLIFWIIDQVKNQYFGKVNIGRINDPMYSHNKKYNLLLKNYTNILERI